MPRLSAHRSRQLRCDGVRGLFSPTQPATSLASKGRSSSKPSPLSKLALNVSVTASVLAACAQPEIVGPVMAPLAAGELRVYARR